MKINKKHLGVGLASLAVVGVVTTAVVVGTNQDAQEPEATPSSSPFVIAEIEGSGGEVPTPSPFVIDVIDGSGGELAEETLAGTNWAGEILGATESVVISVELTFEEDGTILFTDWNNEGVTFDSEADTYTEDENGVTIYVSDIETIGGVTLTSTSVSDTAISFTGVDELGNADYTFNIVEVV